MENDSNEFAIDEKIKRLCDQLVTACFEKAKNQLSKRLLAISAPTKTPDITVADTHPASIKSPSNIKDAVLAALKNNPHVALEPNEISKITGLSSDKVRPALKDALFRKEVDADKTGKAFKYKITQKGLNRFN